MNFDGRKKVRLGDISIGGKGSYGIAAPATDYSKDLYTYLRITDITDDGVLKKDDLKSVDDPKAEQYLLQENDIVFARTGNSTGRSYFYNPKEGELVYAGFLIKFSLDPIKLNPAFMKYYTLSNEYKNWVQSFSTGSTRGNINAQTYANMEIELPSRKQQDLLVDTLSLLDKKIELNNRMNKELEQLAQAIFKEWFIDFEFPNEYGEPYKSSGGEMVESELGMIPKGWKTGKLADVSDIIMGQSPKSEFYNTLGEGMPFHQGVANYGYRYPSHNIYCTQKLRIAKEGSILMSVRAPVGRLNIADCDVIIGRGLCAINSKHNHNSYLFSLLQRVFAVEDQYGSGTIFNSISRKELEEITIINPPLELMKTYDEIASNYNNKIFNLCRSILILSNLRDTLLPKLMSGEIDVSEIEI